MMPQTAPANLPTRLLDTASAARQDWVTVLNSGTVQNPRAAREAYGQYTTALERVLLGAVKPRGRALVQEKVRVALRRRIPLYPISTDSNWGYGCALPACDGCVTVDLSGMRASNSTQN